MKTRTLVLYSNTSTYYFDRIKEFDLSIQAVYKNEKWMKNKFLSLLRKMNSNLTSLFYGDWYNHLDDYSKIIVLDTPFSYDHKLLENIARKEPEIERFYYSWNIVRNEQLLRKEKEETQKNGFKFYCYDKGNCEKYGLYFNTIMYDETLKLPNVMPEYDTCFLGFLKDRKEKMKNLYDAFQATGLNARFVIVKRAGDVEDMPFEYRESEVGYYEYLDMINHSRSILDITQKGQDGLSLRIMEAIFLNKKILTTNEYITEMEFYNPNNILVIRLGETSKDEILDFFNKPFCGYSDATRKYYSFKAWADRFK